LATWNSIPRQHDFSEHECKSFSNKPMLRKFTLWDLKKRDTKGTSLEWKQMILDWAKGSTGRQEDYQKG
jgi:hypothetical protein